MSKINLDDNSSAPHLHWVIKIYKEAIKNVPFLKYSWVVIATACITLIINQFKLKSPEVFNSTFTVLLICFICFVFSYITKSTNKAVHLMLRLLVAAIIITSMVFVLGFATFVVIEKPVFFKRWFPVQEDFAKVPIKDSLRKNENLTPRSDSNKISNANFRIESKIKRRPPEILWIPSEIDDAVKLKIADCLGLPEGNESNGTFQVQFGFDSSSLTTYPNGTSEYLFQGKVTVSVNKYKPFTIEGEDISRIPRINTLIFQKQISREINRIVTNNITQICVMLKKYHRFS